MKAFSTKKQFVTLFMVLGVGLAISFALAVYGTVKRDEERGWREGGVRGSWLLFGSWVCYVFPHNHFYDAALKRFDGNLPN